MNKIDKFWTDYMNIEGDNIALEKLAGLRWVQDLSDIAYLRKLAEALPNVREHMITTMFHSYLQDIIKTMRKKDILLQAPPQKPNPSQAKAKASY